MDRESFFWKDACLTGGARHQSDRNASWSARQANDTPPLGGRITIIFRSDDGADRGAQEGLFGTAVRLTTRLQ
jgi:hypothetical protein